jgi:prolyl oligopeptidase
MTTRKQDLVEKMFGTDVADPYRWLEDGDSDEVRTFTRAQNEATEAFLRACPARQPLRARIRELLKTGYVTAPSARKLPNGTWRYFWTERRGEAVQPTLVVRDGNEPARPLIDVGSLSADGTDALDWFYPSRDGQLLAWGRSRSGSEKSELHLRDVASGRDLEDTIPDTRASSVAWIDAKKFFYTRRPPNQDYDVRVYEHVIGRSWKEDPIVYGEGRAPEDIPEILATPNGQWLVVRVHLGWDKSELFAKRIDAKEWIPVAVGETALFEPIPTDACLYVMTNSNAPRFELCRVEWGAFDRTKWKAVLPQRADDVLVSVLPQKDRIVAAWLRDAATIVEVDGKPLDLGIASAELGGSIESDEAFVMTTSFTSPTRVSRIAVDGTLEPFASVGPDLEGVLCERVDVRSKDGTMVPMFVVRRKDTPKNAPAIITGYGGFNVNATPAYSVRAIAAVENGCVLASCVLRGGGERGEAWHEAGMLHRKQNVFDDFIACAEELRKRGANSIGAIGGSNGGLLVSAVCVQRPDLFRAGVALVPLTDMIRYPKFRIGRLWVPEYGDPENPEHFRFLFAYSPYHHVEPGVGYPSMLFATAEADSRVDPMHARKMAARMQEVAKKDRPVLLRVEEKAGHGQGKPASKAGEEIADELAFLIRELA